MGSSFGRMLNLKLRVLVDLHLGKKQPDFNKFSDLTMKVLT
jgi:hypothetical protein